MMDFQFTEEQLAVKEAARDFAEMELLPGVIERDEKELFPAEQVKKMGEMGLLGMMVSPQYGGGGMDTVSYVLAMEEIAKVDASAAVVMSVNNSLVCWGLEKYGTEEQKQKYLVPLAQGQIIGAFCLSEPEAGSDATSQRTTAEDKGDYYLLKKLDYQRQLSQCIYCICPNRQGKRAPGYQCPDCGKRYGGLCSR